ncbi:MAG: tRNA (adenosine(37)-N6)-threonylcarbamoyltransferase complex transferase subunit TsaD [Bacteroidia bacterium]|nr:tRNA (adenosine(37)-N6)-threonylcarbamoyltransferase complex transferase subunit TsaD [Bacteroidia bacterium]
MPVNTPIILAIESSCDETSVAIIAERKILANVVATQAVHQQYGGVVPELASRAHLQNIWTAVHAAVQQADVKLSQIQAVAYTRGPGLLGALLVGTSFAKALALALNTPLIEVNHIQAHILAHLIEDDTLNPEFPFLCLTVSGGHTQLVLVHSPLQMEIVGETIDDAAGEAFDKAAKILGLPYPGGPLIDKLAQTGNANTFTFPYPQTSEFSFSFSGIKTSFLYFINQQIKNNPTFIEENKADICASIQAHIVLYLIKKFEKCAKQYKIKNLAIAGGVSANSSLRKQLLELKKKGFNVFIPSFEYCTDNAAMIAIAAYYKFLEKDFSSQASVPLARMPINTNPS